MSQRPARTTSHTPPNGTFWTRGKMNPDHATDSHPRRPRAELVYSIRNVTSDHVELQITEVQAFHSDLVHAVVNEDFLQHTSLLRISKPHSHSVAQNLSARVASVAAYIQQRVRQTFFNSILFCASKKRATTRTR